MLVDVRVEDGRDEAAFGRKRWISGLHVKVEDESAAFVGAFMRLQSVSAEQSLWGPKSWVLTPSRTIFQNEMSLSDT